MLNIETKTLENMEVIVLEGEIDMYVAPGIRDALLGICKDCSKGVAVDLSKVSYIDSSGIATLIEGLQWSKKAGQRFILIGARQNVWDTLKLARLHNLFEMYPDQEQASASFR